MRQTLLALFSLGFLYMAFPSSAHASSFRHTPYVQNPCPTAITVIWFSERPESGELAVTLPDETQRIFVSTADFASALAYLDYEQDEFPNSAPPPTPYRHSVRVTGLSPGTAYPYQVTQGGDSFEGTFRTNDPKAETLRFIVYADSETEPESTGTARDWADPSGQEPNRQYVVDQTTGYEENLRVIRDRDPAFVAIAGDLVETGGEQRDWDEFWRHNLGPLGIASGTPILPVPGNHEYYGAAIGFQGYDQAHSDKAMRKYETYFDLPSNGAPNERQRERYYRVDYGPAALIFLDSCNGEPNESSQDSNWFLLGESEGGTAPDFNPASRQYQWLEEQLADARNRKPFVFVFFHHVPYSAGPHGFPAGNPDKQSGQPLRVLQPLFARYGVDAVFCGHDEMYERSEVNGTRELPDGSTESHSVHYYDIGIGGDGLRGPRDIENPHQKFLAHSDSPEQWAADGSLTGGGKHYGHLEVNISRPDQDSWQAKITPAYIFPLNKMNGGSLDIMGFERRLYDDEVIISKQWERQVLGTTLSAF